MNTKSILLAALSIFSAVQAQAARPAMNCYPEGTKEYCDISLISSCAGRSACSIRFGQHYIYLTSKAPMTEAREDLGTGEMVMKGTLLPSNPELTSDMPMVKVTYQPTNPDTRWVSLDKKNSRTTAQKLLPTTWPLTGEMSEKQFHLPTRTGEADVVFLSVKVRVDLDKNRTKSIIALMKNSGLRLESNLNTALSQSKAADSIYGKATTKQQIKSFESKVSAALAELKKEKRWARDEQLPVTRPQVMEASRAVYAYGKYLIAALQGQSTTTVFVDFLADFVRELNAGFGFNPGDDDSELGMEVASSFSSAQDRKIAPILQVFSMALDQTISNLGLHGGDARHQAAWNMQEKQVRPLLPNYRLIAAEKGAGEARKALAALLNDGNLRGKMPALAKSWQSPEFFDLLSEVKRVSEGDAASPLTTSAKLVRELVTRCKQGLEKFSGLPTETEQFPLPPGFDTIAKAE